MAGDTRLAISVDDAVEAITQGGGTVSNTVRDQLEGYVAAATRVVEDLVGPVVPETRTWVCDGGSVALGLPDGHVSNVAVTVDGVEVDAAGFTVDETAGIVRSTGAAFASGRQNVSVAYDVGYLDEMPGNVRLAVMEQVRFLWQTSRQGATRDAAVGYTPAGYAVPYLVIGLCEASDRRMPGFA